MPIGKTHPHIDRPTEQDLRRVFGSRPAELLGPYLELHRLVLETLPEDLAYSVDVIDSQIGYAAHQYGYDGWGMAALAPYSKWVSLGFLRGASLSDPAHLLEGTGAEVRHVKVRSAEQLTAIREPLSELLRDAAGRERRCLPSSSPTHPSTARPVRSPSA